MWYPQNAFLFNLIASFLPELHFYNRDFSVLFSTEHASPLFFTSIMLFLIISINILHKCTHKIVHFKMNKMKHLCGLLFILFYYLLCCYSLPKKWEMNCFSKQFTPSIFNWNSFISPPINWQHCRRISSSSQHHIFIFNFFMYSKSKCIEFVASSFSCLFVFLLHWNSFFKIERSCNQLPRESSENVWTGIDLLCFYFAKKWKLFVKNVCCGF